MEFPDWVVKEAWKRAGGVYPPRPSNCECRRKNIITFMLGAISSWYGKIEAEKVVANGRLIV